MINKNIVLLGASPKPQRFANRAQHLLLASGYVVLPVARVAGDILGVRVYVDLADIDRMIDTVTIYLRPEILVDMLDKLLALRPRRVIFNPGTESNQLANELRQAGIIVVEACTLILLETNQFEIQGR